MSDPVAGNAKADRIVASYMLLCDSHSMNGGKHNYYGVFSIIGAPALPCAHPSMHLAVELLGPMDEEAEVRILFLDSDDAEVVPPPPPTKIRFSPFGVANLEIDLQGLPLPKAGIFTLVVEVQGRKVAGRTLYVQKV